MITALRFLSEQNERLEDLVKVLQNFDAGRALLPRTSTIRTPMRRERSLAVTVSVCSTSFVIFAAGGGGRGREGFGASRCCCGGCCCCCWFSRCVLSCGKDFCCLDITASAAAGAGVEATAAEVEAAGAGEKAGESTSATGA
jgi:hypothetical protein